MPRAIRPDDGRLKANRDRNRNLQVAFWIPFMALSKWVHDPKNLRDVAAYAQQVKELYRADPARRTPDRLR